MLTLSNEAEAGSSRYPRSFGKYLLLSKLAEGGMGEVFAALLPGAAGFEKKLVIKRILPHLAQDERFVSLFLSEARLTASLHHPNICQVYELGEIDGQYFLSMEYLEGVPLSRLLRQHLGAGLEPEVACGVISQAAEGLEHAHRFRDELRGLSGIIHRDISPANLFVTTSGVVKVLDFGVAKVSAHAHTTVTGLKGKYPYMSPEQIRGADLDARSDVFSLGVVLWETLTGRPLFHRDNEFDVLQAIVGGHRPAISELRPAISPAIERVVDRALAIDRSERFSSAAQMCSALLDAARGSEGTASPATIARFVERTCIEEIEHTRTKIRSALSATKHRTPAPERRRLSDSDAAEPLTTSAATSIDRPISVLAIGSTISPGPLRRRRAWVAPIAIIAAAGAGAFVTWQLRTQAPAATASSSPPAVSASPSPAEVAPSPPAQVSPPPSLPPPDDAAVTRAEPSPTPVTSRSLEAAPTRTSHGEHRRGTATKRSPTTIPVVDKQVGTGYLTIDAVPFAEVYVDGNHVGTTPVVKVPVTAGKHRVRLVGEDGHQKNLEIEVVPGRVASRRITLE